MQAMRLAGSLRAAAVTDIRIVPDKAGGPMMSRHLRVHSFDPPSATLQADDDGLFRVDPDKRAGACVGLIDCHDRAHAGPSSASSAKSA
jgi:hypothetical protein